MANPRRREFTREELIEMKEKIEEGKLQNYYPPKFINILANIKTFALLSRSEKLNSDAEMKKINADLKEIDLLDIYAPAAKENLHSKKEADSKKSPRINLTMHQSLYIFKEIVNDKKYDEKTNPRNEKYLAARKIFEILNPQHAILLETFSDLDREVRQLFPNYQEIAAASIPPEPTPEKQTMPLDDKAILKTRPKNADEYKQYAEAAARQVNNPRLIDKGYLLASAKLNKDAAKIVLTSKLSSPPLFMHPAELYDIYFVHRSELNKWQKAGDFKVNENATLIKVAEDKIKRLTLTVSSEEDLIKNVLNNSGTLQEILHAQLKQFPEQKIEYSRPKAAKHSQAEAAPKAHKQSPSKAEFAERPSAAAASASAPPPRPVDKSEKQIKRDNLENALEHLKRQPKFSNNYIEYAKAAEKVLKENETLNAIDKTHVSDQLRKSGEECTEAAKIILSNPDFLKLLDYENIIDIYFARREDNEFIRFLNETHPLKLISLSRVTQLHCRDDLNVPATDDKIKEIFHQNKKLFEIYKNQKARLSETPKDVKDQKQSSTRGQGMFDHKQEAEAKEIEKAKSDSSYKAFVTENQKGRVDRRDPYLLLGIEKATLPQDEKGFTNAIHKAFRKQSLKNHPDRHQTVSVGEASTMQLLTNAQAVLLNPYTRKLIDWDIDHKFDGTVYGKAHPSPSSRQA